jgi:hypothetical protein
MGTSQGDRRVLPDETPERREGLLSFLARRERKADGAQV